MMKPKHKRLAIVGSLLCLMLVSAGVILVTFKEYAVFFVTPKDVIEASQRGGDDGKTWRLGGLVKEGSLIQSDHDQAIIFIITDYTAEITVQYQGIIPTLFREGQGVVAQGAFDANGVFQAETLLAKHDEYYLPPEVVKALKESGRWQHEKQPTHINTPKADTP